MLGFSASTKDFNQLGMEEVVIWLHKSEKKRLVRIYDSCLGLLFRDIVSHNHYRQNSKEFPI